MKMRRFSPNKPWISVGGCFLLTCYLFWWRSNQSPVAYLARPQPKSGQFSWNTRIERHPVLSFVAPPSGKRAKIPAIQYSFGAQSAASTKLNGERRDAVKAALVRGWNGYRKHAWMKDELTPVSGSFRNHFGGWAATLVDSLDTLWIMGMKDEFEEALLSLKDIDFTTTDEEEINVFETTIRYLGGMLAAHDLSEGKYPILLEKCLELGDMLYAAFDTPNRMPLTRWHWKKARDKVYQEAQTGVLLAEIGSLSLEFTRLSQLSGDPKFFDAIQRIYDVFEAQQALTRLPGMWPLALNAKDKNFTEDTSFTFGAMTDSMYEYLPKQFLLLGGLSNQPRKLYELAMNAAKSHLFFRPMTYNNNDILISGNVGLRGTEANFTLEPQGQHLACFVGGMMAIGSRIFSRPDDLLTARKLVDGCIWAYKSMPTGIMPELFYTVPCDDPSDCVWDPARWHRGIMLRRGDVNETNMEEMIMQMRLPPGVTDIPDRRYILRFVVPCTCGGQQLTLASPEAIESVFMLYRITGDEKLRESAWEMFQSIEKHTKTDYGNTALDDMTVLPPRRADSMESFWTAETLKYFYLIFSPPDLISLDKFVFNTEAHPFRRPK